MLLFAVSVVVSLERRRRRRYTRVFISLGWAEHQKANEGVWGVKGGGGGAAIGGARGWELWEDARPGMPRCEGGQ